MIHGLLVTHGEIGNALVDAVVHFLGPQENLRVISNTGHSATGIRDAVREVVNAVPASQAIVLFTDLAGGSCEAACRLVSGHEHRCEAVTGVNLPMLLEFCHYRERLELPALLERVMRKGRDGVSRCEPKGA